MSTSKTTSMRPEIRLLAGRHRRALAGHPWVYSNEIEMTADARALAPGALVRLKGEDGKPVGTAFFNPRSLIAARLLTFEDAPIDTDFIGKRLDRALALRQRIFDAPYYRLVNGEGDGLPGLIVDRYGEICVVQVNAAGMERLLPELLAALDALVAPKAVLLRNEGPQRALEGLETATEWVKGGGGSSFEVVENRVTFHADLAGGQKTGWFFDHGRNRAKVASFANGARVLDVFCYLGGFAIQALVGGAAEAVLVDRSQPALDLAEASAAANGVAQKCRFDRANGFGAMERLAKSGERFDIVIADPPSFVKSKKEVQRGIRGYRKMVRLAAPLVAPGGLLFAASCSYHVEAAMFGEQIRRGLAAGGRGGRILYAGGAGPDHPIHPFLPETAYLKFQLLQLD
jgi:23S rRNA (cytosine1962-C5)-methyltransferase